MLVLVPALPASASHTDARLPFDGQPVHTQVWVLPLEQTQVLQGLVSFDNKNNNNEVLLSFKRNTLSDYSAFLVFLGDNTGLYSSTEGAESDTQETF